ncbi:MAG TPA: hypothetical protein VMD77_00205 [Candidatus Baltobacteraceae bacterium]|nr:hypothetical protein [Candidatus Baltobacteraceae bacterium]
MNLRKLFSARSIALSAAILVASVVACQYPAGAQSLTASANPPSGLAGVNNSYLTGSGFPAGTITGGTVSFASSCAGPATATTAVIQVAVEGVLRRFEFAIPASLKTGTYSVWVSGTAGSTPFNTLNTPSCSTISVTASSTTLAACVPTSSLAVTTGTNVNAYIPFASWYYGTAGVEEVPLEGSSSAQHFSTGDVNSCASNSVTGEVVCTENDATVDVINGSTLTSLTSGANTFADFTGGSCENCGVAINAANNTALIAMGLVGGGGTYYGGSDGVQVLNLASNTFNTAVPLANGVSEDISIDSQRNYVLSPAENGIYDLIKIGSGNSLTEYGDYIAGLSGGGAYLDSAAEDCTTGIALSADEFTDSIYITDLTQATFTAGSPGTWTAPGQFIDLEDGGYAAGPSGISTAPGTNHLAVVTGEFGGSSYAVLQLPSTSGSGTPTLADYAYVGYMPNTPAGNAFSAGADPHAVSAYTSPNTNKSYAVFTDYYPSYSDGTPDYVGVVDMACVLALPRTGAHIVSSAALSGTGPGTVSSCTRYVAIP